MVTRVHGAPRQGMWFSADVRVLTITATNGAFLADLTAADPDVDLPNSGLEQVLEAVATRATIIGLTVEDATTLHVMVDYANAFTAGNTEADADTIEEEVAAAINAIDAPVDLSDATVDTFDGFAGLALGTPA